ncbi:hypothetical protein FS749_006501 [Ceratobasidium sp. UAMH 11750]|nr:hypothetical protein FS749_006501 [Ceratobasidium sp. UAMH 11750]
MSKHGTSTDADGASDRGQPVVTYVRVGRGMIKTTRYVKEDKAVRGGKTRDRDDAGSIHSFDSSQPAASASVPSVKSRASSGNARAMPAWIPKFKRSKKSKKGAVVAVSDVPTGHELPRDPFASTPSSSQHYAASDLAVQDARSTSPLPKDNYLSPPQLMPTPPSSPAPKHLRPLRATHSHGDLSSDPHTATPDMTKEPSPELPEDDSDDSALAYLQALGLEPAENAPKSKPPRQAKRAPTLSVQPSSQPRPLLQPTRSATLPPQPQPADEISHLEQARHDALIASIINPPPAALEQYASRHAPPRPDYITTARRGFPSGTLGLVDDSPSRSPSPLPDSPLASDLPVPDSPARKSHRRELPPRPPPPNTFAPYAPANSVTLVPRVQNSPKLLPPESPFASAQASPRNSPLLRPQGSPMSLAPPPPNAPRSGPGAPQLALPLVRVRITSPPHRGALRALPALVMLSIGARAAFAAATWAQMVAYCARNAGVAIARRGGGGILRVAIEERMAELTTPGGGRGVADEEVGFGLGYYISVEMVLEGEGPIDERLVENSVPVASLSIPLPTTMGEVATVFRERKDIRKALS